MLKSCWASEWSIEGVCLYNDLSLMRCQSGKKQEQQLMGSKFILGIYGIEQMVG